MSDTAIASIIVAVVGLVGAWGGGRYLQRKQGDATIVDSASGFAKTMMERLDKVEAMNAEMQIEIQRLRGRVFLFERHIERLEGLIDSEGLDVPARPTID